ncbi:MAG TPA: hypothetical protein H9795_01600 [Candidatus Fournierella merdigallinarum]|nr:hypothetical protein [Candidatus Fournierella merdigallinarum]
MPCVYILLTRTDTLFARLLHGLGKHRYTHASLALDRDLGRLYSFARRYEPFMLPGGFIRENIHAGVFGRCGGADSLLLELPVSRESYEAIERRLAVMASAGSCWDYDLLGLALAGLGIPHVFPGKYFCSQFVADVLAGTGALALPCHPSLVRPGDFAALPGLRVVYQGPLAWADRRAPFRLAAA